jgi:hypothetical protein
MALFHVVKYVNRAPVLLLKVADGTDKYLARLGVKICIQFSRGSIRAATSAAISARSIFGSSLLALLLEGPGS